MSFKQEQNRINSAYANFLKGNSAGAEASFNSILDSLQESVLSKENEEIDTDGSEKWIFGMCLIAAAVGYIREIAEKSGEYGKSIAFSRIQEKILTFINETDDYITGRDSNLNIETLRNERNELIDQLIETRTMKYSIDPNKPEEAINLIIEAMERQKERQEQKLSELLYNANKGKDPEKKEKRMITITIVSIFVVLLIVFVVIRFVLLPKFKFTINPKDLDREFRKSPYAKNYKNKEL